MSRISLKYIWQILLILFLLSHSGRILEYLGQNHPGQWFYDSLQPLRDSSLASRYVFVMLLLTLIAVIFIKKYLFHTRKREDTHGRNTQQKDEP